MLAEPRLYAFTGKPHTGVVEAGSSIDSYTFGAMRRARASGLVVNTSELQQGSYALGETLKPYVPRLLIEWMRESPEVRCKAIDGSLVFVDISGFTALTERLARRGKIGAELMRDALDGVFTALLDEAYDWGAGLIKWGGDALLLLFDGPLHAERATRAAWEMQHTIDRVGRLRVSGGYGRACACPSA